MKFFNDIIQYAGIDDNVMIKNILGIVVAANQISRTVFERKVSVLSTIEQ
jgi:hypothetical protein